MYPKTHVAVVLFLKMKDLYYGNGKNEQEDRVTEIFKEAGFIQSKKTDFPKNGIRSYMDWIKADCFLLIPEGTFVKAYFGENQHPDYISREGNRLFWWECKSSKDSTAIQFNTTLPHKGIIFIITMADKTVLALGEWLIKEEEKDRFQPFIEGMKDIVKLIPKDVPCWGARPRNFFHMNSSKKLVFNGYGDECSETIIKIMTGETYNEPVKLDDFKSLREQENSLVQFFRD